MPQSVKPFTPSFRYVPCDAPVAPPLLPALPRFLHVSAARFLLAAAIGGLAALDQASARMPGAVSAPISDMHYNVTIDSEALATRHINVVATLSVAGPGPVVLALPAWTPGAYELSWFSRWVSAFTPTATDGRPLTWDKVDYETWRIDPAGAKSIRVAFATWPTRSIMRCPGPDRISYCSMAPTSFCIPRREG